VIGGIGDPNVLAILRAAKELNLRTLPLLTKRNKSPSVTWDIGENKLSVDGKILAAKGAFIRRDVFHPGTPEAEHRSLVWYETWRGWLASQPEIRLLNRSYLEKYTNKLSALGLAGKMGLAVPTTLATNDLPAIHAIRETGAVVKPVTGGGYCRMVDEILSSTEFQGKSAANPAIVQKYIKGNDVRIYRIHRNFIGFRIQTKAIDYRTTRNYTIKMMPEIPSGIADKLEKMMDILGLDWGAADFKESAENGNHYFLEVNSNPMFSVFDKAAKGVISKSIVEFLAE
jgi:glutathione synthase/RimK-type ligase-like ATP-grasp enzyme